MATTTTTSNSKLSVTQAQALRWLIDNAPKDAPEDVITAAERLFATKTKTYNKKSDQPTKQQIINRGLARDVLAYMTSINQPVTAKGISNNVQDVRTPQKAVALVKLLIADGVVIRFQDEKKQTWYKLAGSEEEE